MAVPVGPPGYLLRHVVARRLGVSPQWVLMRFDGRELRPVKEAGRVWYDPNEVDALSATYRPIGRRKQIRTPHRRKLEGQIAAQVFALFEEGCELTEIVARLQVPPYDVEELYTHWRHPLEHHERRLRTEAEKRVEEERRRYDVRREFLRSTISAKARALEEENYRLRLALAEKENAELKAKGAAA